MSVKKIIPYINGENDSLHNILQLAKTYSDGGADELMIYNYTKEEGIREEFLSIIKKVMKEIDIPLHIGYHVCRMEDIKKALYTGASTIWIPYQDGLLQLLKDGVERFGGNRFVVSFDMSDFVNLPKDSELSMWIDSGVKALVLKHVVLNPASLQLMNQVKLPIYIRDSLIRNDIYSLISIDSVEAIATNFYENKDLMKAKLALNADGISVNVYQTSIPFTEFKVNSDGLIPVIVQDYKTAEVLMLAYMNEEAYNKTIATGRMTYFSRSRQSQWTKGETSGHHQYLKKLIIDCDQDTILAKVRQVGPACHTGEKTCFHKNLVEKENKNVDTSRILEDVYQVITDRKKNPKDGSYTNYLFDKGIDKILKKCGEESTEIIIAAKNPNAEELRYEISDYLYHLMVLMVECGLEWSDITDELVDRK